MWTGPLPRGRSGCPGCVCAECSRRWWRPCSQQPSQVQLCHLAQTVYIDLRIDAGATHAAMAEMIGDLLQSEAGIEKLPRARVPETMRAAPLELHALLPQSLPHHGTDAGARQWPERRIDGDEHGPVLAARPSLPQVSQDGLADRCRQRIAVRPAQLRPPHL